MTRSRRSGQWMLAASLPLLLSSCALAPVPLSTTPEQLPSPAPDAPAPPAAASFGLPSAGAIDYQLGGASEPLPGTVVVVRDASEQAAEGILSICYVNGFQTQPGELDGWLENAPEALLRDEAGTLVTDPGWPDEVLLDTRTAGTRAAIVLHLTPTLQQCAEHGFAAVEFDNLDTYARSHDALNADGAIALATDLVAAAAELGLAAGQKNALELGARGRDEAGFTFAITEECDLWSECDLAREVYGDQVMNVEYTDDLRGSWSEVCARGEVPALTVLRDRMLAPPSSPDHELAHC